MSYPQIIDYNEALQNPRDAFVDPELKFGRVSETALGLPLALSGGFALTYTIQAGSKKYAVRCFHREIPEAQNRYVTISKRLGSLSSGYFVHFDFQATGIRIRGKSYPVVKMDWAEGDTLGAYLDRVAGNNSAVSALRKDFADLAQFLESNGIAHGDIQNENVIVRPDRLKLIDYDGMFVPDMEPGRGSEVGQKHFQHPGRTTKLFGPLMDRFSFIVIDVSLAALTQDPSLHHRFREGGQTIIFKANDFRDPSSSEVFHALERIGSVRDSAVKLAAICDAPVSQVPSLVDFRAGNKIPQAGSINVRQTVPFTYIGAYPVIDASDFTAVTHLVGDKVELVGRILSVFSGTGRRGRGRGKPYIFVNFGLWHKESVKVTLWSEGLGAMAAPPNKSWEGRWISVTGLVEPPYNGNHYGKLYRSIGVTVVSSNQIIQITEEDAKFRLGRAVAVDRSPRAPAKIKANNASILVSLGKLDGQIEATRTAPSRRGLAPSVPPHQQKLKVTPSLTRNAQILEGLKTPLGAGSRPAGGRSVPPIFLPKANTTPVRRANLLSGVPEWVWVIVAIVVFVLLAGIR